MKSLVIIILLLIIFLPNNLLAYNPDIQSAPFQLKLPQINTDIIFNFLNKLNNTNIFSNFDISNRGDTFIGNSISNILLRSINFWSDLIKTFLGQVRF